MQVDSLPAEPQGKPPNTGVGSLFLLQRIFLTQESNWSPLHWRFFTSWATREAIICKISSKSIKSIVQFSSVAQSCPTLCDPMDCSMPGLPVHYQLLEFTQTHVHWVGDAIQPSHPLSVPFSSCLQSFPASGSFQMSQFFASDGQSIGVSASTSVLPVNTQWIIGIIIIPLLELIRTYFSALIQQAFIHDFTNIYSPPAG